MKNDILYTSVKVKYIEKNLNCTNPVNVNFHTGHIVMSFKKPATT